MKRSSIKNLFSKFWQNTLAFILSALGLSSCAKNVIAVMYGMPSDLFDPEETIISIEDNDSDEEADSEDGEPNPEN